VAIKRIIPISSGKGGVGKTTFAINFSLALSRHGRTVLVDLDTGTSAIRNAIDVPIEKDLYHFFRKGESLNNCVTHLSEKLDPRGAFRNFGFVAGPLHLIDEITNSGVLIFTPHLPSATLAASDIVKAILFRKLRLIFSRESPFYATVNGQLDFWRLINELIDQVEDVYDSSVANLDAFADDLAGNLGDHPITRTVQQTLDEFRVHYVLNLFNGVEDSFQTAVKPFIENLTSNVSARCGVTNLGWITRSDAIHRANCNKIPALLLPPEGKKTTKGNRVAQELDELRSMAIGIDQPRRKSAKQQKSATTADPADHLSNQLNVLRTMFDQKKDDDFHANFDYASQRALFTMKTRRASEFGDVRIYRPDEMLATIFAKSNIPTTIDWGELEL
jgi:hypothetical protein